MTVRVTKQEFNLREKLIELDKPIGIKGSELMKSETTQDARDFLSVGRKNMVINGAMQINQRNGSSTHTGVTDAYTLDRYKFKENTSGAVNVNRDAFPAGDNHPEGFRYALQVACSSADTSLSGTEHAVIMHMIEGYDIEGTGWGTLGAKDVTLSFWVKTTIPGTYSVSLSNGAQNKCQVKEYQAGQYGYAPGWEKIEIVFKRCIDGSWDNNTGTGIKITWGLAGAQSTYATSDLGNWKTSNLFLSSNQVNFMQNTNARFFITGVQLEIGQNATDFEHRRYHDELALCKRYYQYMAGEIVNAINNNSDRIPIPTFPVEMRAAPSYAVDSNVFTEFSAGTNRTITAFWSSTKYGGGYAQLNSSPSNGVYVNIRASADL